MTDFSHTFYSCNTRRTFYSRNREDIDILLETLISISKNETLFTDDKTVWLKVIADHFNLDDKEYTYVGKLYNISDKSESEKTENGISTIYFFEIAYSSENGTASRLWNKILHQFNQTHNTDIGYAYISDSSETDFFVKYDPTGFFYREKYRLTVHENGNTDTAYYENIDELTDNTDQILEDYYTEEKNIE